MARYYNCITKVYCDTCAGNKQAQMAVIHNCTSCSFVKHRKISNILKYYQSIIEKNHPNWIYINVYLWSRAGTITDLLYKYKNTHILWEKYDGRWVNKGESSDIPNSKDVF